MNGAPPPVDVLTEQLGRCAVASLFDVMDELGLPNQCLSIGIRSLTARTRLAGPAMTLRGSREPRFGPDFRPDIGDFGVFDAIVPGCIVVVNAEGDATAGHWGEQMSLAARQAGALGAVIDGGTRDLERIDSMGDWPVFGRYASPIESKGRWRVQEIGVPVFLEGSTTSVVQVRPGDYLVGDSDGVVVVPIEVATEVATRTLELEDKEESARQALAQGVPIREVFARFGRL